jgi:hypothetical protein
LVGAVPSGAGDLAELLGVLRDRLEPVRAARGIDLHWQVAALSGTVGLGVAQRLDVLRIVQEVFASIVKHAGPCQATLLARPTAGGGGSLIVIADNGAGWQVGRRDGVGLPSRRERAQRLNAGLEIGPVAPASPGCRMALSLPPPAEAAAWDGGERRLAPRPPLPAGRDCQRFGLVRGPLKRGVRVIPGRAGGKPGRGRKKICTKVVKIAIRLKMFS